jgi:hypothetical protein
VRDRSREGPQPFPELVQRTVGEPVELADGLGEELGGGPACEPPLGGPRRSPQQCLVLRPEPHGQGWLRPPPGTRFLLIAAGEGGIRAGRNDRVLSGPWSMIYLQMGGACGRGRDGARSRGSRARGEDRRETRGGQGSLQVDGPASSARWRTRSAAAPGRRRPRWVLAGAVPRNTVGPAVSA